MWLIITTIKVCYDRYELPQNSLLHVFMAFNVHEAQPESLRSND